MFLEGLFRAPVPHETKLPWRPWEVLVLTCAIVGAAFFAGRALFSFGLVGWATVVQTETADGFTIEATVPLQKILLATNVTGIVLLLGVAGRLRVNPLDALALRRPKGGLKALAGIAIVFIGYWMLRFAEAYLAGLWGGSGARMSGGLIDAVLREGPVIAVVGTGIAAPFAEELLFRGFLLPGLAKTRLGFWGAAAATSVAFALVHVQQYGGIANVVWIVLTGLMFAWALRRTESVWTPIGLHVVINTTAVTALLMRQA